VSLAAAEPLQQAIVQPAKSLRLPSMFRQLFSHRLHRPLSALAIASLISGCAFFASDRSTAPIVDARRIPSPVFETAQQCSERLLSAASRQSTAAFGSRLVVATWNVHKSVSEEWKTDLDRLADEADILLLQEAAIGPAAREVLPYPFVAVSEGYRARLGPTGILSASHVDPLASCTFIDREPLLQTPKASSIASYALDGSRETLLVANVHAINFSFGIGAFRNQLERIASALRHHEGPIVFAGDFNAWNARRAHLVAELTRELGLREVNFGENEGKRFLGYPLDRIFWRGMHLDEARVEPVGTSDHDPLIARWHLRE
jgi:endonuclease/exonuclease/phosphatase (EEP) superfamily protein YafD